MKKKIFYVLSIIILIAFIVMSMINNQPVKQVSKTYFYLGTVIDITVYDTDDDQILKDVSDLILKYENMFSRNILSSDISKLNQSTGPMTISEETYKLIKEAITYSELTKGYFDITINPIVELWAIGTEEAKLPKDEEITQALKAVDYRNIVLLEYNQVELLNGATIDLGGIAKGFIADEIVFLFEKNHIEKALINLGGNVFAIGSSIEDTPWNIGIRHPVNNHSNVLLKVMLDNKSVVTSGIYERFLELEGVVYHHIFDPYTGYPMDNELLSLTVVSDGSIDGDALSTGLFNLGLETAFKKASELSVDIIVVTKDNKIYITPYLSDKITVFDENYLLITKE
ncbi:MAG: FAD:protein FMN transferase [Clostridiales bacterium]|nr:FAD:protein FMN transferase [Clostridiales bacterium]